MKLQTNISLEAASPQIDYGSDVLLMGSCFTETIGEKLEFYTFNSIKNPFGVLFHPIAIQRLIERAVSSRYFTQDNIFETDGLWHCLEVHSLVTAAEPHQYLKILNDLLDRLRERLLTVSHVLVTFGTAWGYRHLHKNEIVANCHKLPQNEFDKELSSVDTLSNSMRGIIEHIRSLNTRAMVIMTVSPVRHLKDGFVENNLGKAHLITAVHKVVTENDGVHYFPAYEIMMDELRDYRFYAEDLLHPNALAIQWIWEQFSKVWINPEIKPVLKEVGAIRTGLAHRPMNPDSLAHKKFQKQLRLQIKALQKRFPSISFDDLKG